ncbi:MAG: hypothetical protein GF332_03080 [Candidatus Moranbacteria bacterium]|nr:hypothetical protein [Candidatus Moranbacteria bacterium]
MKKSKQYCAYASNKRKIKKPYFYKRKAIYKQKYLPIFGDDWIKKFKSNYRIKKEKEDTDKKKSVAGP